MDQLPAQIEPRTVFGRVRTKWGHLDPDAKHERGLLNSQFCGIRVMLNVLYMMMTMSVNMYHHSSGIQ